MQKGIIKNVNRLTGEPVDAQDLASIFTGIVGNESGVLTVFDELRLEKISNNKVRLHSGVYSLKGHMLYIPKGSYEDFEIESGTLGANRIDLLVAEYVKNGEGDGEDTLHFRILKGETTSGTPQVPTLTQQDINENGITRQEMLYQIRINENDLNISFHSKKIRDINGLSQYIANLESQLSKELNSLNNGSMIHRGFVEDANKAVKTGTYHAIGSSINLPTTPSFLLVFGDSTLYKAQMCVHWNSGGIYMRTLWDGEWKEWRLLN